MSNATGTRFKQFGLVLVATLVGALLVEALARLFVPIVEPVLPKGIGQFDAQLGWRPRPNANAVSHRTGRPVEYRINSNGLRGRETPYAKPDGIFRITLVGDSNTFGFGVPIEMHFSTLIEGYFSGVEVVNLGVEAYGVDQELLLLRAEGFRYEPDLVVVYVPHFAEDRHMHTERFGRAKPRFELVDGRLVLQNSPLPAPGEASVGTNLVDWLANHSRAVMKVRQEIRRMGAAAAAEEQGTTEPSFERRTRSLGAALIWEMARESADHGAEFALVTRLHWLHDAARERGLASLAVYRALLNPAFSLPDGLEHMNEAANGAFTAEVARFLECEPLIPRRHWRRGTPAC